MKRAAPSPRTSSSFATAAMRARSPPSSAPSTACTARTYRPHAAREDPVLFPAFHDLLGEKAYRELGEKFEDQEKKQLGNEGFEGAVAQVAKLEEQFGFADLDQFTPR